MWNIFGGITPVTWISRRLKIIVAQKPTFRIIGVNTNILTISIIVSQSSIDPGPHVNMGEGDVGGYNSFTTFDPVRQV